MQEGLLTPVAAPYRIVGKTILDIQDILCDVLEPSLSARAKRELGQVLRKPTRKGPKTRNKVALQ